jgi:hypothetical protein
MHVLRFGTPSTVIMQAEHRPIAQKKPRGLWYFMLLLKIRSPLAYSAAATVSFR